MTPGKDVLPADERQAVLLRIAKLAKRQGAWQLAAKKYTQVGAEVGRTSQGKALLMKLPGPPQAEHKGFRTEGARPPRRHHATGS